MTGRRVAPPFEPSGFFALRSPLLPFDELETWAEGVEATSALDDAGQLEQALTRDRARLRARLRQILERPEIAEALLLASPTLFEAAANWHADPDSRKGKRAEDSLVRYFQRMASRPTPFGLFSGCSLGALDATTRLRLAPRAGYQKHTRLDMDYLFALCEDLGRDPALRGELTYRPNSSLYRAAGRLRYAEARMAGKARAHLLVALDSTDYLEATLALAAAGAKPAELAAALVAADPEGEVTLEEAAEYVNQLIETQVLVSDLSPGVTGPEAIHGLEEQLAALPTGRVAAAALGGAREALATLDAEGLGVATGRYRSIAETLRELPTPVELSRLFQVDLVKPAAEARLGAAVVEELQRGLTLLHRLFGRTRQEVLDRFRQDFLERYGEGRWVPLVEALDDEAGIGFDRAEQRDSAPLLHGLDLGRQQAGGATVSWGPLQTWQLRKLEAALARGEQEIELTEQDAEKLALRETHPLSDALAVTSVLAAASEEDADRGRFQLLWKGAGGPSGGRILGRFCHADAALEARLRDHLAAEEAVRPDAIFAEVVHLPQGRIGNILSRPVLRDYEISFLGRSGAPAERQIPLTDLQVTVANQRIVLRSARLGREVIPRLTSAHNFSLGLGAYRFLCGLQDQGTINGLGWNWGALESAAFLPRVRSGRLVLQRARWRLSGEEIKALCTGSGAARFAGAQRLRAERRMPRHLLLADGDNELLLDFDNVLSVEAWLDVLEGRQDAFLFELFPRPGELCARGPEGAFVHELVMPFVRARSGAAGVSLPSLAAPAVAPAVTVQRSFLPGSEWLYAKLYLGTATADTVLREVVGPVTREVLVSGAAHSWFFIRYGDPHWHLSLRFHGAPRRLVAEVVPALEAAIAPLLRDGRLWRMQLDTYDREIERYGGPAGIGLCERLFHADSEAVLSIVDMLEGDEGAAARWRLAACGIDLLLGDLGLDADGKRTILRQVRDGFFHEFGGGKPLRVQLDRKQRVERRALEALLDAVPGGTGELAPGLAILRHRSERNAPIAAELRRLEQARRLTIPVTQLAPSLIHMQVNRLIRSAQRAHELVLYDLLSAIYDSRAARAARVAREVQVVTAR
ncbi:MAG TPA: lantibiotic dehydratase [Thermoanaerobaculia bacterium]|nr:lantibiotic dehydratase [Thermoanaerobaculia bacterium]